ncbi:MAG TPA: hypothetical protein VJU34_06615, partial [Phenylobacterium sp.]|nr:hypothetical protein [Phenylobacterium sp.]
MVTTVSSSAALYSALKAAHGGDTILLAPGTYTPFSIKSMNFSSEVTIASADATKPAVLTGFTITSSSGIAFENLELRTDLYTEAKPYQ